MKFFKKKIFAIGLAGLTIFGLTACDDDFEKINTNPNDPEVAPTNMIFNGATRYLMNYTRDGWWSGRLSLPWMQYSTQYIYIEEDKYQYRESQTSNGWFYHYKTANDLKSIIDFCENPDTRTQMEAYGNIDNQIAVSRIMLSYVFDQLAAHFGDVPYWSYGNQDPDFQALQIDEILQPKYASQQKIYADILNELKAAANQLNTAEPVFISGDNIYNGDAEQWRKFANSLRLRIANRIKHVYPEANAHISDAIASGVFTSNADNAVQSFGTSSIEGSPFWETFAVGRRQDFAANSQFVNLLKGVSGNFGIDPRLPKMIAPIGYSAYQVIDRAYTETPFQDILNDTSLLDQYIGEPYGMPSGSNSSTIGETSFMSFNVMKPDFGEVLMEYSEVEFILSELNGWSQSNYEAGVRASMEKWGVDETHITAYIANLPAANEENVITQKYITLFMQPQEAWVEYRRTGYPDGNILLLPGQTGYFVNGDTYTFTPLQSGNVIATDIPSRVRYPISEQNINSSNYQDAVSQLSNGDEINSKLWWAN